MRWNGKPSAWCRAALFAALALAWIQADAGPPVCYPGSGGCTAARLSAYEAGLCVAWYMPGVDDWEPAGYCLRFDDIAPDASGSIAELWFSGSSKSVNDGIWQRQVTRELEPAEKLRFNQLLTPPPPSLFAVARSSSATRPTYPVVNGARSSTSNGRVLVGARCGCSLKVGNYCSVAGEADASRPGRVLAGKTVSLCAKR